MAPQFSKTESDFIHLVNNTSSFDFNGKTYKVIKASKPRTSKGECKTDVFIQTDRESFKISIKQSNADFLENKISYVRAKQIFGPETDTILRNSIHTIEDSFKNHPLICFCKSGRTEEKTIVLGWKFELLNVKSGEKSGLLQLTDKQKINIYSGNLLDCDKRNASVDGDVIPDSGVADYILEIDDISQGDLQFYIDKLEPITDFSCKQNIYFACKALNYRALKDKWDGDRPLAVYVKWSLINNKLEGVIDYEKPLQIKGNTVGENVRKILNKLNINKDNFEKLKDYYMEDNNIIFKREFESEITRTSRVIGDYEKNNSSEKSILDIVSFFSGAGGLDLGFEQAGFNVIWANEYDKDIWDTYEHNHPDTFLERRSITNIDASEVPECDGIIGGPPCQSWSEAGAQRGIEDKRGQLFFDFIRILEAKKPKFFLAENVSGMQHSRHQEALANIKEMFKNAGYDLFYKMLNAHDYGAAQDRKRVIFIGFRTDLNIQYQFPDGLDESERLVLRDIIKDLDGKAVPALEKQKPNPDVIFSNHEYMIGGFSSMYMSRNRVRSWDQPSFTIQAGGRHAPIHPSAPKMENIGINKFKFIDGYEYRRLSVRECARIQGFPDNFEFIYKNVATGYKMIGNAVAVPFARAIAESIKSHLNS